MDEFGTNKPSTKEAVSVRAEKSHEKKLRLYSDDLLAGKKSEPEDDDYEDPVKIMRSDRITTKRKRYLKLF